MRVLAVYLVNLLLLAIVRVLRLRFVSAEPNFPVQYTKNPAVPTARPSAGTKQLQVGAIHLASVGEWRHITRAVANE